MKQAFIRKAWVNKSRKAKKSAKDNKNVYQVVVRPGKNQLETELNAKPKTTILSKHENSIADSIFIHTSDEQDVKEAVMKKDVVTVVKQPKRVPMGFGGEIRGEPAYFPTLLQTCSVSETQKQAGIVDSVGSSDIQVNGAGTLIIVWDFVPGNASSLNVSELTDRPGGKLKFYPNDTDAIASHGAQVSSIAAGKEAGLAKGANLALLGLSNDIFEDLVVIEKLIEAFEGPAMINMSFGLEWENVDTADELQNVNTFMAFANEAVSDIKSRFPKTLFFIAAGNETQNMCDEIQTLTYSIGNRTVNKVVVWPQFERNASTPFIAVGATTVKQMDPTRKIAIYSNYGDCIDFFAHGGALCGWDTDKGNYSATQGTSFASPIAASIASLLFSAYPSKSGTEIVTMMKSMASGTVTGQFSPDTTSKFLQLPAELKRDSSEGPIPDKRLPDDVIDGNVVLEGGSGSPEKEAETEFKIPLTIVVLLVALVVVFAVAVLFSKKKESPILSTRYVKSK